MQALGNVRVRSAPVNGDRVTGLAWGQIVPVIRANSDRSWLLIEANGVQGWVAVEWFDFITGSISQVPTQ